MAMRCSNIIIEGRIKKQSGLTLNLIECGKLSKQLKNGLKTKQSTLSNHSNLQKCEISVVHEMHFKHVFKMGGGGGGENKIKFCGGVK